jgi:hypothetical protein
MNTARSTLLTPEMTAGLALIVARTNPASRLGHPSDFRTAVEEFARLYDAGEYVHPDEVEAHMTTVHGWPATSAKEAAHVWEAVATLRDVQLGRQ